MASTFKTFVPNEILTADDVNDALNPTTADHIPRAVAANLESIACSAGSTGTQTSVATFDIDYPPGRFSSAPVVTVHLQNTYLCRSMVAVVTSRSSSGFSGTIYSSGTPAVTVGLAWHAIQM